MGDIWRTAGGKMENKFRSTIMQLKESLNKLGRPLEDHWRTTRDT